MTRGSMPCLASMMSLISIACWWWGIMSRANDASASLWVDAPSAAWDVDS